MAGTINVVSAVIERMTDASVAQFVADSVIAERGATERLAHAFQALVPDTRPAAAAAGAGASERSRRRSSARRRLRRAVAARRGDADLVLRREVRLGRVRAASCRARATRAVDVERVSDDPPERIAAWLATVSDAALRSARSPAAARSAARSRPTRALARHRRDRRPRTPRTSSASATSTRPGSSPTPSSARASAIPARTAARARRRSSDSAAARMMKHVAAHLRGADDDGLRAVQGALPRHRAAGDPAARRGALGRAGRARRGAGCATSSSASAPRAASRCSS